MSTTHSEKVILGVALEARSAEKTTFLLEYKQLHDASKGELKKRYGGAPDAKAFEKWKAEHPLGNSGAGKVTMSGGELGHIGSWPDQNDTITFSFGDKSADFPVPASMWGASYTPTAFVDPTGRRALVRIVKDRLNRNADAYEDASVAELVITGGPCVEVLAPRDAKAGATAADAAEKAGFAVASMGVAKQERNKTVVFAPPGREVDAAKLAAALPGGASVEKLTWKSKADFVIAVGR